MLEFEYLTEASVELVDAIAFYEAQEAGLGARFAKEIRNAIDIARQFPNAGFNHRSKTKRVMPKGFPYSVVYRVLAGKLRIVAIEHHSRRPGYWRGRN